MADKEQEFLEQVMDTLDIGIYVIDKKGDYVYSNRAVENVIGVTREELRNTNVYDLLEQGCMKTSISRLVFEQKRQVVMIQRVITQSGNSFRQMVTSQPLLNQEQEVEYAVASVILADEFRDRFQYALVHQSSEDVFAKNYWSDGDHGQIVAESREMRQILRLCERIAQVKSPVLITGESGTGKEVIANYIHKCSCQQEERPFVAINCAALPVQLLESELFGYEKGAFTGAGSTGKAGLIELADGGTLFLDEINSAPLEFQSKLLRVLETGEVQRLGSVKRRKVNFRLISATNKNLQDLIDAGSFRQDLYYRLSVLLVELPPLREHKDDIVPLCDHFLKEFQDQMDSVKVLSPQVVQSFLAFDWPGNIRELRNVLERLVVMSPKEEVLIESIPSHGFPTELTTESYQAPVQVQDALRYAWEAVMDDQKGDFSLQSFLEGCESVLLSDLLQKFKNTYQVADLLKVNQATVARKKKKYGITY